MVSGANPAHGIETARGQAADRVLSREELKALGKVLTAQPPSRKQAVNALRLIALTGLRREEAVGLRWSEFDEGGSCLRLENTKTGRSMRAIGKPAVDLLVSLPRDHEEWVFPNGNGTGSRDLKRTISDLFDLAKLPNARSHDLRRTFATIAAEDGCGDGTISDLLGHSRRGVTERHYIRRPDAALVSAATSISMQIESALSGEDAAERPLPLAV